MSIDTYSEQGIKLNEDRENSYVKSNELSGRVRCAYFKYTASGAQAADQVLGFTKIPINARYLGGKIYSDGALEDTTLDVGLQGADGSGFIDQENSVADAPDLLGDGINIANPGVYDLLNTEPSALGYELDKECWVTGTLITTGLADGDVLSGVIYYVTD